MMSKLESLANELFIHEIFPYLSLIDLNYALQLLNQRFKNLLHLFLTAKIHHIQITFDVKWHEIDFTMDHVLPYLSDNQQFKAFEVCHADSFVKLLSYTNRINIDHLNKVIVTSFVDIHFDVIINFVSQCFQLNELKLNILTNSDSSWANGRKWIRWFETMKRIDRHNILKTLEICVWCVNISYAINFDSRQWSHEGVYRDNRSWRVRLKPDHCLNWQRSRQCVEFSRSDQDYLKIFLEQQHLKCILS